MKDLQERLRHLPPHSAVLRSREPGRRGRALSGDGLPLRVASAANAPTYSWADAAVDSGIVGGRRRDQVAQTKAIATLALRVLRGERADDIPVSSPNTDVDQVDWRQLRRWGSTSRVCHPDTRPVSEPSVWDQYSATSSAPSLMLAQSALIAGLLVQRTKRNGASSARAAWQPGYAARATTESAT